MPSFKGEKLRVNLRLSVTRLKLLEKKKTEDALKARREIADYIKNKRTERARIRVEHIIREDYIVEAMEVIELYCDLLLARFGMLEQMSFCEESLAESVSTLIWVAPRLCADVQELNNVSKELTHKFGKPFAESARSNTSGIVNPKVIHRLGAEAPRKSLVENYMIEIARNYKVDYVPDPSMLIEDDDLPPPPPSGGEAAKGYIPEQAGPLPTKQSPDHYTASPGGYPNGHPPVQPQGGFHLPPAYPGPPSQPQPPLNPNLPYPTGPQAGIQPPGLPPAGGSGEAFDLPPVPGTVPTDTGRGGGGGDVDFDDLTRRFEELKRRQ